MATEKENILLTYFRRFRLCITVSLASILILFVVMFSLLRLSLPYVTDYGKEVEQTLSEITGMQVSFKKIDAEWHWFTPRLILEDVSVYDEVKQTRILNFDEVYFGFSWIDNLLALDTTPNEVTLVGGLINVTRLEKGVIDIHGFKLGAGSSSSISENITHLVKTQTYHLVDTSLIWHDETTDNRAHRFTGLNFTLQNNDPGHRIVFDTTLPANFGKRLTVVAEMKRGSGWSDWTSQIYIKVDGLHSQSLENYIELENIKNINGEVNAELWVNHNGKQFDYVAGELSSDFVGLTIANNPENNHKLEFSDLNAGFKLRKSAQRWSLSIEDFNSRLNGVDWKNAKLNLVYDEVDHLFAMQASNIMDQALSFAGFYENKKLKTALQIYVPEGKLQNLHISSRNIMQPENMKLFAKFSNAGFSLPEYFMSYAGVDGELFYNEGSGSIAIKDDEVNVSFTKSSDTVTARRVIANAQYKLTSGGDFSFDGAAAALVKNSPVYAEYDVKQNQGDSIWLRLRVDAHQSDMAMLKNVLSANIVSPDVETWINESLHQASFSDIGLIFQGKVTDYPFSSDGVFQLTGKVSDGRFHYIDSWPEIQSMQAEVKIDNDLLLIQQASAVTMQGDINNTNVNIHMGDNAKVVVDGVATGNYSAFDEFFLNTSLKDSYKDIVSNITPAGKIKVDLHINVPLTEDVNVDVSGDVALKNNSLRIDDLGYRLSDIEGLLRFSNTNISAEKLSGKFHHNKVSASIQTRTEQNKTITSIAANVTAGFEQLWPHNVKFLSLYKNKPDWKVTVDLYQNASPADPVVQVLVGSLLKGTQINLPEPFAKQSDETKKLNLLVSRYSDRTTLMSNYGDVLDMRLVWPDDAELLGSINVNAGTSVLPEQGVRFHYKDKVLNLDQWFAFYENNIVKQKNSDTDSYDIQGKIEADKLIAKEYEFSDVKSGVKYSPGNWEIDVACNEIKAVINVPSDLNGAAAIKADIDYLKFPSLGNEKKKSESVEAKDKTEEIISAKKIPALKLDANKIELGKYRFDHIELETSRNNYGMVIHHLGLTAPDLEVSGRGSWLEKSSGQHHSAVRLDVKSSNLGAVLKQFDLTDSLIKSKGTATIDWQWNDAIYRFDWMKVKGRAELALKNGAFRDVEPGAGRLLGMFSFNALPRRFLLDFSDTFNKGYEFNKLTGSATFDDGNLYTKNTQVTGVAADVRIEGRVGITTRDFDQVMTIIPSISSGVSGWLAVLQGVSVGAAAYIGQKLFGVDEAAKNRFKVTGSWDKPIMTEIK